jgi:hypothetical protein
VLGRGAAGELAARAGLTTQACTGFKIMVLLGVGDARGPTETQLMEGNN